MEENIIPQILKKKVNTIFIANMVVRFYVANTTYLSLKCSKIQKNMKQEWKHF